MPDFDKSLEVGKLGESEIAGFMKRRGYNVLPVYEVQKGQYKGPSIYAVNGDSVVAPDMLAFKKDRVAWIEAKHKSSFTWHRKTNRWVTGIDLHHYHEYLRVMNMIEWPVWLLFLHRDGMPAPQSPEPSPTGLYGNSLANLFGNENHIWEQSYGHQKHGMIYWSEDMLFKLSEYPL